MGNSFYAEWRLQAGAAALLNERSDSPPERLLQAIWQHQRLLRDQLTLEDGRTLRVLHPGFWSREGGPDFQGTVVQFDNGPFITGDVEVDIASGGWHAHRHDINPAFKNVVLHVIWDSAESRRTAGSANAGAPRPRAHDRHEPPPALAIRNRLDAPIGELSVWLNSEGDDLPPGLRGQCCGPLRQLASDQLLLLLNQAAAIRFQSKAAQFEARARQCGWEQALWEGLFRALGYKHNSWPMQCLAELRQRWLGTGPSALALQARLLGIGGLLPADLTRARSSADCYLRQVWDHWWREREEFSDCILPRSLWRFHGQRPANHPQRRLALAAHWLTSEGLPERIETWCTKDLPDAQLAISLLEVLQTRTDPFWSWHWTVRSPRLNRSQPLLGSARVTDLAVNVILPWLWIRAAEGRNQPLQEKIERRFAIWPAAEDNALLKFARQRILGGARGVFRHAAAQQGLIQIVRDFCDRSNALCHGCDFPDRVRRLGCV